MFLVTVAFFILFVIHVKREGTSPSTFLTLVLFLLLPTQRGREGEKERMKEGEGERERKGRREKEDKGRRERG